MDGTDQCRRCAHSHPQDVGIAVPYFKDINDFFAQTAGDHPSVLAVPGEWKIAAYVHISIPEDDWHTLSLVEDGKVVKTVKNIHTGDAGTIAKGMGPNVRWHCECLHCGDAHRTEFMVKDEVWAEAKLGPGTIHLGCLEEQLGRLLTADDFEFDRDIRINEAVYFGYCMGNREHD